jgi:hypothetical protein
VLAWVLTSRHLWMVDYFAIAFSLASTIGITTVNLTQDTWFMIGADVLVQALIVVLMML